MEERGWDELDILFVSGDAYVDHPAFGTALLARLLESAGYRVGILAQPAWQRRESFLVMGRPRLFAAVTAGAMDSLVNHYTAAKKRRNDDAYTPGGRIGARPNRAVIAYTAAVKGAFPGLPVVIGGIEASLRRLAHYDYWDNRVRRSILVDSKADLLLFGMAETALLEVAQRVAAGEAPAAIEGVRGTVVLRRTPPAEAVVLPSFEAVAEEKSAFAQAFVLAEGENNPRSARPVAQQHGTRWVVAAAPPLPLDTARLDAIYALPFLRRPHPGYTEPIPAFEQIRASVTTHRGCCGGCAFCAIGMHQGKTIQSRSQGSIVAEVEGMVARRDVRGTISDLGGPSANMYGLRCSDPGAEAVCRRPSCLWPRPCPRLATSDRAAVALLDAVAGLSGVRHLFVSSGIRFDLLPQQRDYLGRVIRRHVGGLLKVAPESFAPRPLQIMRKPGPEAFVAFLEHFRAESARGDRRQGVVPYMIAGHPGMTLDDLIETALALRRLGLRVEQVQEFTPTPGTLATCIYYTGCDPYTGAQVYVPRDAEERRMQKALLLWHLPESEPLVAKALRRCGREGDRPRLLAATSRRFKG